MNWPVSNGHCLRFIDIRTRCSRQHVLSVTKKPSHIAAGRLYAPTLLARQLATIDSFRRRVLAARQQPEATPRSCGQDGNTPMTRTRYHATTNSSILSAPMDQ